MPETLYCPWCGGWNLTPVYADDGVTIRYYRCAPDPDGCGRIVRTPIIGSLRTAEEA